MLAYLMSYVFHLANMTILLIASCIFERKDTMEGNKTHSLIPTGFLSPVKTKPHWIWIEAEIPD